MSDEQLLDRIASDPAVLDGKPVVRGTRLSVEYILNLLAHGATPDEIVREYRGLAVEDVRACLLYASRSMSSTVFLSLAAESV
jgi:uncharacterized protein (DUF433 family)